jgi:hypothetical protein
MTGSVRDGVPGPAKMRIAGALSQLALVGGDGFEPPALSV